MAETTRTASTPRVGALRDSIRTALAVGITLLIAKVAGEETATSMGGAVEAISIIIISAAFAWVGKLMRDKKNPVGKVV